MNSLEAIPDAEALRYLLAAPGGADIALIEIEGRDPFYVGLDMYGELAEIQR